jgi:hypothetical protein
MGSPITGVWLFAAVLARRFAETHDPGSQQPDTNVCCPCPGGTSDIHSAVHSQFDVLSRLVSEIAWLGVNVFFLTLSLYQY